MKCHFAVALTFLVLSNSNYRMFTPSVHFAPCNWPYKDEFSGRNMLISPSAIRLLRVEYTIGNFALLRIVEIDVVRTNSQCSAENTEQLIISAKNLLAKTARRTNAHFAPVDRFHRDMLSVHGHVLFSAHSSRPAHQLCIFCIEFLRAAGSLCTIRRFPSRSTLECDQLFEPACKTKSIEKYT